MMNECLDNGDWAEDAPVRLRLAEQEAWYKSEQTLDSSSCSTKSMRKSDSSQIVSEPPSKKTKDSTEDQWKTDINNTLAALSSMVQQLASAKAVVVQQEAPPIPPLPQRSEEQLKLIADVREFVNDNPQASTPSKSNSSDNSNSADKSGKSPDETIPKQRALPKAPIPRKKPEERSTGKNDNQDDLHMYEAVENYYDSIEFVQVQEGVHQQEQAEVEPDPEIDQEPELDLGRLEKRKMFLSGLKTMVPDLKITQPQVNRSGRFGMLAQKPKENIMPFLTELFDQISLNSEVKDRRTRDPFNLLKKYYPTSEPAESGVLQGRDVPRELIDLVIPSRLVVPGASGRKAILKNSSAEGAKEEAAKVSLSQASGYIRLTNNLEIDSEVMQTLSDQVQSIVSDLEKVCGLPAVAQAKVMQLSQKVRLMGKAVYDVRATNADFARCALSQYQIALNDRRSAWISASMVLKGTASELRGADYPRPSQNDAVGRLDMFGPVGSQILKEYDQLAKDGKVPTPQAVVATSHGRGGHGGKGGHHQYSGPRNQPQFSGNHSNFRGQGHGRGQSFRGRHGNRRPRNNYRGGRGNRGHFQQPFSQSSRPQNKE
jgi:hypothetical protein